MATVSLSKALKLKNRQIGRVQQIRELITKNNCYIAGSEPDFDTKALYQRMLAETQRLWRIKASINAANARVQPIIYELAETKGLITFLKEVKTERGILRGYGERQLESVAQMTAVDVRNEIERLEKQIDDLQDQLDTHNATTQIEVEEDNAA